MEVHADALAVGVYAESDYAVEKPEEQIDERQDEAEKCGDAYQLCDELACLTGEQAGGNEAPEAADGVDGDGARGVVDGDGQLKDFDQKRCSDAGDETDEEGLARRDQGRTGAGGDEAGEPAVGAEAGVGFAEADAGDEEGGCCLLYTSRCV